MVMTYDTSDHDISTSYVLMTVVKIYGQKKSPYHIYKKKSRNSIDIAYSQQLK